MTDAETPPPEDEFELTLLGPGYGESIVLHVGGGVWVLIDSCLDPDGAPGALRYLERIGVDPARAVALVVASHWHDDHIRGMARLVEACGEAVFCCAGALCREEFLSVVGALEGRRISAAGSGVREIHGVFTRLGEVASKPTFAVANRRIFARGACEIWSLSPDDAVFQSFLQSIGRLVPGTGQTRTRIPVLSPNEIAVALWVEAENISVLLGADLEKRGWAGILRSGERPAGKASTFKLPHHGSANADEPGIWERMLEPAPIAVLAPWRRGGRSLPSQCDVTRILARTENAYATARTASPGRARKRGRTIDRTIRESGIQLRNLAVPPGIVRLRRPLGPQVQWRARTYGSACRLQEFFG